MYPKCADIMANNIDPDQTVLSDQGLQCLPAPDCPKTWGNYGGFCASEDLEQEDPEALEKKERKKRKKEEKREKKKKKKKKHHEGYVSF